MRCLALGALVPVLLASGCHISGDDEFFAFWPGDFNADGFADVTVGAPLDDDGGAGTDRGRVYVFYGSSAPDTGADATLFGTEDGAQFGFSVAAIGDFNGDGEADLAVGAPLDDADDVSTDVGDDRGRVFIYYGGTGFGAVGLVLSGTEVDGQFGFSVARAGDVNGDGYEDLLVGAPFENAGGTDRGRAYLFLGGAAPSGSPALTFDGGEDLGHFGHSANTAGDTNGDGYFDLIIGAPDDDADIDTADSGEDRGRAFLYLGGGTLNNSVDRVFDGTETDGNFGTSVAGFRDLNVDGYDDIGIGAPRDDGDGIVPGDSGADLGRVFIYFGFTGVMDAVVDRTLTGTETGARFGEVVVRVGDVNAGGAPDVLVGAPRDDGDGNATDSGADRGRAFLFFGGSAMDSSADVTYTGAEDDALFGSSAGSPGDVDGDGFRDAVMGAPLDDGDGNATDTGEDVGRAFLFRGASAPPNSAFVTFTGAELDANLGRSVAALRFTLPGLHGV